MSSWSLIYTPIFTQIRTCMHTLLHGCTPAHTVMDEHDHMHMHSAHGTFINLGMFKYEYCSFKKQITNTTRQVN